MAIKKWFLKFIDMSLGYLPLGFISAPRNDENDVLSPLLHVILGLKRKMGSPVTCEGSPEEGRAQYRKDVLPLSAGYKVENIINFSIPFNNREIPVRHYIPYKENQIPALIVYFHGGGYVIGDMDTHDDICRLICKNSGMQVLSVDYRLAPESPYPACIEDAEVVVEWVQRNAERFSIDKDSVLVGGDSAGATIAATTANNLAGTNRPVLAQLLIYPGTDRSSSWDSYEKFGYDYFLNLVDRDWFYSHYTKNCSRLAEHPNVSPLKYDFDFPATRGVVVTAGFDVLRDEGRLYVEALKSSQEDINHLHFRQLTHGFVNLVGVHKASEKASIKASQSIRETVISALIR